MADDNPELLTDLNRVQALREIKFPLLSLLQCRPDRADRKRMSGIFRAKQLSHTLLSCAAVPLQTNYSEYSVTRNIKRYSVNGISVGCGYYPPEVTFLDNEYDRVHEQGSALSPSLSIIIPAYNEEARLPSTLHEVIAYVATAPWRTVEILVVDDGSRDRTVEVAEEFARNGSPIRVLHNPGNCGKGYAVRHGMLEATGEWLMFSDADLSTPIQELEKLWAAVRERGGAVAIGSRALDRSLVGVHQPMLRERAGQIFNWVMRRVLRLNLHDTQCGFKLFRQDAARAIFERQKMDRFSFDAEALFLARKLGFAVHEVPVRWNNVAGSKVSLTSGARGFVDLLQVRLNDLMGTYNLNKP